MNAPLDGLIALNPREKSLRQEAASNFRDASTHELLDAGFDIVEDLTAVLCAIFCDRIPPGSRHARSLVRNDAFTAVAMWLQIVDPHLEAQPAGDDLDRGSQLLADIWTAIADRSEQAFEHVTPLVIAGHLVGSALSDAYRGRSLLARVELDFVVQGDLFTSLRRCASLREILREVRSQLAFALLTR